MTADEKLKILSRYFLPEEHEWNEQRHVYVGVPHTIRRLNEAGPWSFTLSKSEVLPTGKTTRSGKDIFRCDVIGELFIDDLGERSGSGSDESHDVDTAMKSAQAYALRKAGNLFGIALYLWDDAGQKYAEDPSNLDNLKQIVFTHARRGGFRGYTADELAEFFEIDPVYLTTVIGLTSILEREGVI